MVYHSHYLEIFLNEGEPVMKTTSYIESMAGMLEPIYVDNERVVGYHIYYSRRQASLSGCSTESIYTVNIVGIV